MFASAWLLHVLWAEQAVNTPASENREEQSRVLHRSALSRRDTVGRGDFVVNGSCYRTTFAKTTPG
jgi:hypothetical protein